MMPQGGLMSTIRVRCAALYHVSQSIAHLKHFSTIRYPVPRFRSPSELRKIEKRRFLLVVESQDIVLAGSCPPLRIVECCFNSLHEEGRVVAGVAVDRHIDRRHTAPRQHRRRGSAHACVEASRMPPHGRTTTARPRPPPPPGPTRTHTRDGRAHATQAAGRMGTPPAPTQWRAAWPHVRPVRRAHQRRAAPGQ